MVDAQFMEKVNNDIPILAKNVETLKTEHKNHQRLLHEFNMKTQVGVWSATQPNSDSIG